MYKLLFLLLLVGCSNVEQHSPEAQITVKFYEYDVIVIDSCEYLVYGRINSTVHDRTHVLTHKGNCKNPTHHK